jgi:hypothetical protein
VTVWSMSPLGYEHELDLLEIKLAEQAPVVDRFVIHEAAWHYDGTPKPRLLDLGDARWDAWAHLIRHVFVDDEPPPSLVPFQGFGEHRRWQRENWQRAGGPEGVESAHHIAPDDVVLVSDLDEIVRWQTIDWYRAHGRGTVVKPELPMHRHFLNLQWRDRMGISIARIARGHTLYTPLGWEGLRRADAEETWQVPYWNAYHESAFSLCRHGWHFSWMGGNRAVIDKLKLAAHPEEMVPIALAGKGYLGSEIERRLMAGLDLQGENRKLYWRPDSELPEHAQGSRFAHLRCGPEVATDEQIPDPTYWSGA